jgi:hypothetical protein
MLRNSSPLDWNSQLSASASIRPAVVVPEPGSPEIVTSIPGDRRWRYLGLAPPPDHQT